MSSGDDRRKRILDLLARNRYGSIQSLARVMNVSSMTVRRDLDQLESEGLIRRTHGGAITERTGTFLDYRDRRDRHAAAKRRIGRAAADMVQDGEVVFIDAGTTTLAMAEYLLHRRNLTVVTHSLPLVDRLGGMEGIKVYLLGGEVRRDLMSMVGYRTQEFLATFRFDKAFLGTGGIDLKRGLTHSTAEEIPIKKLAAGAADQVVVVADGSKFSKKGPMYFLPASQIDVVITDNGREVEIHTLNKGGRRSMQNGEANGTSPLKRRRTR